MIKIRIIGVVLVRQGICVQSIGFRRFLPVGRPEVAIAYLDRWGVDEIVVLDLDGTARQSAPSPDTVRRYARLCQVPLSIGGGIRSVDEITGIIQAGADKVVLNSILASNPEIVTAAAELFGSQCLIASIDARREAGAFQAFTHGGERRREASVPELARRAVELGAGEIMVNSIDRDGSKAGYDLELIRAAAGAVGAPVIACGGAGHPAHLAEAIAAGPAAVAVANLLHFTEHSVIVLKRALEISGQPVRLDGHVTYRNTGIDPQGRSAKQPDEALEALRFRHIPEDKI